jgi:hypothetical protein
MKIKTAFTKYIPTTVILCLEQQMRNLFSLTRRQLCTLLASSTKLDNKAGQVAQTMYTHVSKYKNDK